jgi:isocitrate dehydrogenase
MLEQLGWEDAGQLVRDALEEQISSGRVTYDIHRNIDGGTKLATSAFADEVAKRINA